MWQVQRWWLAWLALLCWVQVPCLVPRRWGRPVQVQVLVLVLVLVLW